MLPRSTVIAPFKVFLIALLVTGCGTTEVSEPEAITATSAAATRANALLREAAESSGESAAGLTLQAAQIFFDESNYSRARELINQIQRPAALSQALKVELALLQSQLALVAGDTAAALRWLTGNLTQSMTEDSARAPEFYAELGSLYEATDNPAAAIAAYALAARQVNHPRAAEVIEQLWSLLQSQDSEELQRLASNANSYQLRGWIELERVYRADEFNIRSQLDAIERWQQVWTNHAAA